MLHALLIDDEASARADLREKLRAHHDVTVVGEAATLLTARALLASADYNVVFLDVQLIGGNSFDLVPLVRPGASIVFATAHERYAVRAFESHAVDYLLKPIAPVRLADALQRVTGTLAGESPSAPPVPALAAFAPFASPARSTSPFPRPEADGAEVALTGDERVFLRQMLEAWEDSLAPTHLLHGQRAQRRMVRYDRAAGPTRLFLLGAPVSALRRWWRVFRS